MLCLIRKDGDWFEIAHHSGDVMRVKIDRIRDEPDRRPRARLTFDDSERNFEIRRAEAKAKTGPTEATL